jgi:hypothetical protein
VKPNPWIEEVNGVIVGDVTFPYEFWTTGEDAHRFDRSSFASDADAVEWLKKKHPDHYAMGVEMRVFEGG